MAEPPRPPLAVTQGDPSGIGPEITLRAWRDGDRREPFFVVGDPGHYRRVASGLGWTVPVAETEPESAAALFAEALPVVPHGIAVAAEPGRPDAADAPSTLLSIERAVALVREGRAAAVVTNPISKHVLYGAGFRYPGHTEFLAALATAPGETPPHPVMMLWCPDLAVVPVTVHIPLAEVPARLDAALVVRTARIVARDLAGRFGLARPRLAIAGLNPHAGEAGTMGDEEERVLRPAIETLRREGMGEGMQGGMVVSGPHPADTMFHPRARAGYDAALCMYHDQALIPIKTIAFDEAVNVTLGLPFVRTSPDHGTAFDIAGRGVARPDSLLAAIGLAARLARRPAA